MDKTSGELLVDLLMRIHDRRQQYLHTGFFPVATRLLLGSVEEEDLKFGDPNQTAAILDITLPAYVEVLQELFTHFQIDPTQRPMQTVSLRHIFSALSKAKWDLTKIVVESNAETGLKFLKLEDQPPVLYSVPSGSHFTSIRLQQAIRPLIIGLTGTGGHHDLPIDPDVLDGTAYLKLTFNPETFKDTPLEKIVAKKRPVVLAKGRDLLTPKTLIKRLGEKAEYVSALRLWAPTGRELCYGGYFSTPGYSILMGRLNLFLV